MSLHLLLVPRIVRYLGASVERAVEKEGSEEGFSELCFAANSEIITEMRRLATTSLSCYVFRAAGQIWTGRGR